MSVEAAVDVLIDMHYEAHEQCCIPRSVKAEVRCEPVGIE
jgi:hypothetical protein